MHAVLTPQTHFRDSGACLRMLGGLANLREYTLLAGAAPIRIRVGSSPLCSWRVLGKGIAAEHFDLVWDNHCLTLEPLPSPTPVTLDGETVRRRRELRPESLVAFGEGELSITVAAVQTPESTGRRRKESAATDVHAAVTGPSQSSRGATKRLFSVAREVAQSTGKLGRTTKTVELDLGAARAALELSAEKPRLGRSAAPPAPEREGSAGAAGAPGAARASGGPSPRPRSRLARCGRGGFLLVVLFSATWLVKTHALAPRALHVLTPLAGEAKKLGSALTSKLDTLRSAEPAPVPASPAPLPASAAQTPSRAEMPVPASGVLVAQHRAGAQLAAALLFAGRLEEARVAYTALSARSNEPVFMAIVQVLSRTIEERCRALSPAERGTECAKK